MDSVNTDWSRPKKSSLNSLLRVMEASRTVLNFGSCSSNESGRIGGAEILAALADRTLTLRTLGK